MAARRYLDVRYDVTDLSEEQVGQLALEAGAQAERSEGHPTVEVEIEVVEVEIDEEPPPPASCTGAYVDGRLQHDGDTCPIHETDDERERLESLKRLHGSYGFGIGDVASYRLAKLREGGAI